MGWCTIVLGLWCLGTEGLHILRHSTYMVLLMRFRIGLMRLRRMAMRILDKYNPLVKQFQMALVLLARHVDPHLTRLHGSRLQYDNGRRLFVFHRANSWPH